MVEVSTAPEGTAEETVVDQIPRPEERIDFAFEKKRLDNCLTESKGYLSYHR